MPMDTETRARLTNIAGIAIAFALAALIGGICVRASQKKLEALTNEEPVLAARLSDLTESTIAMDEADGVLTDFRAQIGKVERMLPAAMQFDEFHKALSLHAGTSGVDISEIQPGAIEDREEYVEMPVAIKAGGTFKAIHRFLFELANLPRFVKVRALTIRGSSVPRMCEADMTLTIFAAGREGAANAA